MIYLIFYFSNINAVVLLVSQMYGFCFFFYVHEDDFVFIFETEKLRQKVDGKNVMMPLVDNLKNQNRC